MSCKEAPATRNAWHLDSDTSHCHNDGMPSENEYSLADLADLVGVTPRTVRYYVAQGLLPSPGQVGPGARYSDRHLNRLRLIRRLQREHLPLAEIRSRLGGLDDEEVAAILGNEPPAPAGDSAVDYIRTVLAKSVGTERGEPTGSPDESHPATMAQPRRVALAVDADADAEATFSQAPDAPPDPSLTFNRLEFSPSPSRPKPAKSPPQPVADRSQWDRVALTPDIELHVRRPLSRLQNKQVDRLIAIARELLEGDQS
jgi:DNA-binding transcriptional MerR regulator